MSERDLADESEEGLDLRDDWERLVEQNAALLEALRQIERGEGRFSRDSLTHASNTIEDMIAIARAAIAKAEAK